MAKKADAHRKALEEFDNRVRKLWRRAELDKKRAKKHAKPTLDTSPEKVVVEQKDQAPTSEAVELTLAERDKLLLFLNDVLAKRDFVPIAKSPMIKEAIQRVVDSMTPAQLETVRNVLTPGQLARLNEFWELLQTAAKIGRQV